EAPAARRAHGGGRALHGRALCRVRRAGGGLTALAVALRFLADELEEARRILERREPAGRGAGTPGTARGSADGRDRTGRADESPDRERAEPATPRSTVHATIVLVRLTTLGDLLL